VQTASGLGLWNWWDTGAGATVAQEPEPGSASGTQVPEPMWDRGTGLSHGRAPDVLDQGRWGGHLVPWAGRRKRDLPGDSEGGRYWGRTSDPCVV